MQEQAKLTGEDTDNFLEWLAGYEKGLRSRAKFSEEKLDNLNPAGSAHFSQLAQLMSYQTVSVNLPIRNRFAAAVRELSVPGENQFREEALKVHS